MFKLNKKREQNGGDGKEEIIHGEAWALGLSLKFLLGENNKQAINLGEIAQIKDSPGALVWLLSGLL